MPVTQQTKNGVVFHTADAFTAVGRARAARSSERHVVEAGRPRQPATPVGGAVLVATDARPPRRHRSASSM